MRVAMGPAVPVTPAAPPLGPPAGEARSIPVPVPVAVLPIVEVLSVGGDVDVVVGDVVIADVPDVGPVPDVRAIPDATPRVGTQAAAIPATRKNGIAGPAAAG